MAINARVGFYVLSLEVEGVRCFARHQRVEFTGADGQWAPWTLLLGDNGTGKTTLLESIAAMLPGQRESNNPAIRQPLVATGAARSLAEDASGGANLQMRALWDGETDSVTWTKNGVGKPYHDNEAAFVVGYGADRSRFLLLADPAVSATVQMAAPEAVDPAKLLLQLDHAASREGDEGDFGRRLSAVKATLIGLLPDVSNITIREPGYGKQASAVPSPGYVECETPYGLVPLNKLSLGYQSMVRWMVDLVFQMFDHYGDAHEPLSQPAVVLIDEIDLHLHPSWQRRIMSHLSEIFPATQFIATAHSPLMVQAAAVTNLVVLRGSGDHVEVEQAHSVRGWRVDQVLTSDLFGLEGARSVEIEALMHQRRELLSRPSLTPAQEKKVTDLEAQIGELPTHERADDRQTMDLLRRALDVLQGEQSA